MPRLTDKGIALQMIQSADIHVTHYCESNDPEFLEVAERVLFQAIEAVKRERLKRRKDQ